jgi:DNA polymerase-3 subunit delta'
MCKEMQNFNSCEICPNCKKVKSFNHPDIKYFEPNKEKVIKVDNIKNFFGDANVKPFLGTRKFYIVEDGQKMNIQSQNSILKTVEEPAEFFTLIILCEDLENLLPTIKSRCKILRLSKYSTEECSKILGIDCNENRFIINYMDCVPGRVRSAIEDKDFNLYRENIFEITRSIVKKSSCGEILLLEENIPKEDMNKAMFMDTLLYIFIDILKFKKLGNKYIINYDKINEIENLSKDINYDRLIKIINSIINTKKNLTFNTNLSLNLERMLLDMVL